MNNTTYNALFRAIFNPYAPKASEYPCHLGHGLELRLTDDFDNKNNYCHLVRTSDNAVISDKLWRKGGLFSPFGKENYCMLLCYNSIQDDFGTQCIINKEGDIVLKSDKYESSFSYLKGVLAIYKSQIINLLTGEPILKYNTSIASEKFLFCKQAYPYNTDTVYKINYSTGESEIFN